MKKILFVASESVPFIKTGGLADVVGSLPKYFDKRYFDVRVVIPRYNCMYQWHKDLMQYITNFYMDFAGKSRYVGIFEAIYEGVHYYFIDNEEYFGGPKPYTDNVKWDAERFIFFSRAALSILPVVNFKPDIVHCHDWQAALTPVYMKDSFRGGDFYKDMKSVLTIHNLKFQGVENIDAIKYYTGLSDYYFTPDKLACPGVVHPFDGNVLKGGVAYADVVTTVSPTYAEEIKTEQYGEKLDPLLRARAHDLRGIVNGIDYDEYNPETDEYIPFKYNIKNYKKNKAKNKTELQKQLGLEVNENTFMIGMVSRLTSQKGFDLVSHIIDEMCWYDNIQIVVLGTGDAKYENMFKHFDWKYGSKVSANIYYSEEMSHKIYAAADAFLMPSLFEPCGLSQMMSLKYGTIPIVRETGGLRDTVEAFNEYEQRGTGFSFYNYNAHEMMATIRYAERIYYDRKDDWYALMERAMNADFSWQNSARQYQEMYDWMIGY